MAEISCLKPFETLLFLLSADNQHHLGFLIIVLELLPHTRLNIHTFDLNMGDAKKTSSTPESNEVARSRVFGDDVGSDEPLAVVLYRGNRGRTSTADKMSFDHILSPRAGVADAAAALTLLATSAKSDLSSKTTAMKNLVLPSIDSVLSGSNGPGFSEHRSSKPAHGLKRADTPATSDLDGEVCKYDTVTDVPTPPDSPYQHATVGGTSVEPIPVEEPTHEELATASSSSAIPAREFICAYQLPDDCGVQKRGQQLTLKECRPCVSDHFGRNKSCTRRIPRMLRFCRKHYQRSAYHRKRWPFQKCELVVTQLEYIAEDVPGVTFEIKLKKSEMARLLKDSIVRAVVGRGKGKKKSGDGAQPADASVTPSKSTSATKTFEAPIHILRHIQSTFCGKNKTMSDCTNVIDYVRSNLDHGVLSDMPTVEFLPENLPAPGKGVMTVSKATSKDVETSGRISVKGAVQKP